MDLHFKLEMYAHCEDICAGGRGSFCELLLMSLLPLETDLMDLQTELNFTLLVQNEQDSASVSLFTSQRCCRH